MNQSISAMFDEFWKIYPKREGDNPRHPARTEFDAAIKRGAKPEEIIEAARNYAAKNHQLVGSRLICQARTWLHQRRYEDYRNETTTGQPVAGFYAAFCSPELDAWAAYERRTKGMNGPRDRRGGWLFPTRWPPGHGGNGNGDLERGDEATSGHSDTSARVGHGGGGPNRNQRQN